MKAILITTIIAAAVISWSHEVCADDGKPPQSRAVQPPNAAEVLETRAQQYQREVDQLVIDIIAVAEDKAQKIEVRRAAILMLGKIRTKAALQYLISHFTMELPMEVITGDADEVLQRPCVYALVYVRTPYSKWDAIPLCLDELRKEKARTGREIQDWTEAMPTICGKTLAKAILTSLLEETHDPTQQDCLRRIMRYSQ